MYIVLFCCFGKMINSELPERTILLIDLFLIENIYLAFLIFHCSFNVSVTETIFCYSD